MKIESRYNIGDYIWVKLNNSTRFMITDIEFIVKGDGKISIYYALDGMPVGMVPFSENCCYLTREECEAGSHYPRTKSFLKRVKKVIVCVGYMLLMLVCVLPFSVIQFIYWMLIGRTVTVINRMMKDWPGRLFE